MTAKKDAVKTEIDVESVNNDETVVDVPNPKLASKRGRKPWKPAQLLTVRNKTPGYGYRWVDTDTDNVRRKEEEGWVKVTQTSGLTGKHDRPETVNDGKPTCSDSVEYREMILMAIPDETALDRKEYQANRVREATHQSAKGKAESAVAKLGGSDAPKLHGGLTFD